MAPMYETGRVRRLYLRGRANIRKLLVHACGFNLGGADEVCHRDRHAQHPARAGGQASCRS